MIRKTVLFITVICSLVCQVSAAPKMLKVSDIQQVVQRFFAYHIEARDYNPTLIRRSMKIFVEQFDPDKSYVLDSEVSPYLNLSDQHAAKVMDRLKAGDYSDFFTLNMIFQKAVVRAEGFRATLTQQIVMNQRMTVSSGNSFSSYASSEAELVERQKMRMVRFYNYHESRINLDTSDRKAKVLSLYERKIKRSESSVQFQDNNGVPLTREKAEHVFSTKVLKSIAKSLDTHTSFFSPEEAHEMRQSLEKQFQGVGVVLSEGIDGVMIAELVKDSPAEKNGKIKVNDQLIEVDQMGVENLQFEDVLSLLSKKKSGDILLGFRRTDAKTRASSVYQVTLRKEPLAMEDDRIQLSIEKVGDGIIGKITLHSFYENSAGISSENDIKDAIKYFRSQGDLQGLVLDFRENSGGFLSQAVKVAGLFISNGIVVVSKYGTGESNFLRSIAGRPYFNGPVVVLTSKMSASAAEIVAQALQDYGVGIVVGDERTFGKGSIQYQTITDEKADIFFKVTVGRYYTVSGRSTQIDGVQADILVPTQYAPYNIGERFLEYPLPRDSVKAVYNDPLTDLDAKTQKVFQQRYLPYLQKVVPFWKRILPQLKKNSADRIAKDPQFKEFLRKNEKIRQRQNDIPVNMVDDGFQMRSDDIQMAESVNILTDMIHIEADSRSSGAILQATGS
jgi:carboxyl-terminal processing protease